jgi:hypothetical protein
MVMKKAWIRKSLDQVGAKRISGYQEGFSIYDTYGINCRFYLTFCTPLCPFDYAQGMLFVVHPVR